MKRWRLALLAIAALGAAFAVARSPLFQPQVQPATQPAAADPAKVFDHSPFDTLLQRYVHEGLVDYPSIRAQEMEPLRAYLDALAAANTDELGRDEQLAFYINLYNATVIYQVCLRDPEGFSVANQGFRLLRQPVVRADGYTFSLDDLENRMIRPWYKDERIHAALSCSARSGPGLWDHAYVGKDLGRQLNDRMIAFCNDESKNPVDEEDHRIALSPLFQWYADDFGGGYNLVAYVNRRHHANLAGYRYRFADFDWSLNIAG